MTPKEDAVPRGPFAPAELVRYQDGAVVSKALVSGRQGSVTLFAFDEGQSLSEHKAPFDALIQVVEGEAEVVLSGKAHRLEAGRALLMPANAPHSVGAPRPFKMLLTLLRRGAA